MGDCSTMRGVATPSNLEALARVEGTPSGTFRIGTLPLWEQKRVLVLALSPEVSDTELKEVVSRRLLHFVLCQFHALDAACPAFRVKPDKGAEAWHPCAVLALPRKTVVHTHYVVDVPAMGSDGTEIPP